MCIISEKSVFDILISVLLCNLCETWTFVSSELIIVKYKAHLIFLSSVASENYDIVELPHKEQWKPAHCALHRLQVLSKLCWGCLKGLCSSWWSYRVQFLSKMHSSRVEFQRRMQNRTFSSFLIHGHLTTSHRWALISSTGQVRSLDPKLQVLSLIWFKTYVVHSLVTLLLSDQVVTTLLQVLLLISPKLTPFPLPGLQNFLLTSSGKAQLANSPVRVK